MYPLTHAYFIDKLLKRKSDLARLGSIFPDTNSAGFISFDMTHKSGIELYNFLKKRAPWMLDFAIGVISHGIEPKNLDYFGDVKYKNFDMGYNFENAKSIVDDVKEAISFPDEEINKFRNFWLWKSHNIIESAIELLIVRKNSDYANVLNELKLLNKEDIAKVLSEFYKVKKEEIILGYESLFKSVSQMPASVENITLNYINFVKIKHKQVGEINQEKLEKIMEKALSIIGKTYEKFLEECELEIIKNFEKEGIYSN